MVIRSRGRGLCKRPDNVLAGFGALPGSSSVAIAAGGFLHGGRLVPDWAAVRPCYVTLSGQRARRNRTHGRSDAPQEHRGDCHQRRQQPDSQPEKCRVCGMTRRREQRWVRWRREWDSHPRLRGISPTSCLLLHPCVDIVRETRSAVTASWAVKQALPGPPSVLQPSWASSFPYFVSCCLYPSSSPRFGIESLTLGNESNASQE